MNFTTPLNWITAVAIGMSCCPIVAFAQVGHRIFRSDDNGHSWSPSDAGFPSDGTVNDFAVVGEILFAASHAHGVYRSTDDGHSWTQANRGIPAKVQLNAITSTDGRILIGTLRNGIFALMDDGRTWQAANIGLGNLEIRRLSRWQNQTYASTNGGLFVSRDGGAAWQHLTGSGQCNGVTVLNGNLYAADVRGVTLSKDRGNTWQRILHEATPHSIANDGESVFASLYGGGPKKTRDEGETWTSAQSGLPTDLGEYVFQIVPVHKMLFAGHWRGVYRSHNGGETWTGLCQGIPLGQAITDVVHVRDGTLLAGAGLIASH